MKTLFECAVAMRARRLKSKDVPNLVEAGSEALQELDLLYPKMKIEIPEGYRRFEPKEFRAPAWKKEDPIAPRKPPCTEHIEVEHIFADGSRMVACRHFNCLFGFGHSDDSLFRKRHSDGSPAGTYPELDQVPEVPEVEAAGEASRDDNEAPTSEVEELGERVIQTRVAGEEELVDEGEFVEDEDATEDESEEVEEGGDEL